MGGEEMAGRAGQALLFRAMNRLMSLAMGSALTIANLDEDRRFPIPHDQVDFALAAAVIAGQGLKPVTP